MHRRILFLLLLALGGNLAPGCNSATPQTAKEEVIDIGDDIRGSVSPGVLKSHTFSIEQVSKYDLKEIEITIYLYNKEQGRHVHTEEVKFGSWKSHETKRIDLPLLRFKALHVFGWARTESGKKVTFQPEFEVNIGEH